MFTQGTRFILISPTSGSALPSSVRSFDRHVIASGPLRVMMFVAASFFPSGRIAFVLIIHWSPSLLQVFSPTEPSGAKLQEWILEVAGSHPIHSVERDTKVSFTVTSCVEIRKLPSCDHSKVAWSISGPSPSSTHSPIAHSSPRRWRFHRKPEVFVLVSARNS